MKKLLFIPLALLMMGNQKCEDKPQARELRRRVEMGTITAPPISLPEGGKFDFQFAANAQLYEVLRKTQSFSTSTMDGTYELEQMTQADREAFNKCDDVVLSEDVGLKENQRKLGEISTVATCMINAPQALISGSVTGFELTDAYGVNFNILQPISLGASFGMKKATLSMEFKALDPYIPGHRPAAVTSKANRQEFNLSAMINFGGFGVGPSAYFKSALADVVNKAMVNGVNELKGQMDENSPWFTTVHRNCDKALLINAGGAADAGLKEGDILEVYNVRYEWTGKVCESTLHGSLPSTPQGEPIAVAVVRIVGDTISQAEILEQSVTKIQPGSRVYVRRLIQPTDEKKNTNTDQQRLAGQ